MKIIVLTLLFISSLLAQGPNDYDHEFKGCLMNSTCTKALGDTRNELIKLIEAQNFAALNSYKAKNGILITVWLRPEVKSDQYISWDSSCPYHTKERKFQLAQAQLKSISNLPASENKEIFYAYLYLQDGNTFKRINVPRSSQPIYLTNKHLYFAEEIEGKYYGLKLSHNGEFEIIKTPEIIERSNYTECPSNLAEITKQDSLDLSPYNQYYCKEIWNRDLKKFQKIIFPYSC